MRFNERARLDTSQVEDRRGGGFGGFGGGGGVGRGGGIAIGGGGIGIVVLLAFLLLGGNLGDLTGGLPSDQTGSQPGYQAPPAPNGGLVDTGALAQECQTGADANRREDCRIVGVTNSVQAYWDGELQRRGQRYQYSKTALYSGATQTGCGPASSEVGPFYCPVDQTVYLDLGFFQELQSRFGAQGGPFAEAYVVAHELGHHVQDLTGVLDTVDPRDTGPRGSAVRSELQADCYAG